MELKQLKLNSGEWIIGQVEKEHSFVDQHELTARTYILLKTIRIIHVAQTGAQSFKVVLIPFDFTNQDAIHRIHVSGIAVEAVEIAKELNDLYVTNTSQIEIVPSLAGLK